MSLACKPGSSERGAPGNDLPATLQPLYQEILAVHDAVMPDMQKLTNLQKQMVVVLDTLRTQTPIDNETLSQANRILGDLNRAENAMWNWMHNFGKLDSIPMTEKEKFLLSEKSAVESMRDLMIESMTKATSYLENHPALKDEI